MINFATRSFFIFFMTVGVVAYTNPAVDITNRAMDAHDSSACNQYLTDGFTSPRPLHGAQRPPDR
jgi:hypothetical protein